MRHWATVLFSAAILLPVAANAQMVSGVNPNLGNVVLPDAVKALGLNVGGALKVTAAGAPSIAAAADLSNGATGSGAVVLATALAYHNAITTLVARRGVGLGGL